MIKTQNRLIALAAAAAVFLLAAIPAAASAATIVNYRASDLAPHVDVTISPPSGTFEQGSTFEVPVLLNTHGASVNAIELHIQFDPKILSVIHPSGGSSIIGIWVEPPSYDNDKGTVKIVGAIPGGITSASGLIVTVTFTAKAVGQAAVTLSDASQVLSNDGLGTPTVLQSNRGVYTVIPKPPAGVTVYSDTHPFQDRFYNDPNPTLSWNRDPGVTDFSYILDNQPHTVPDKSAAVVASTSVSYEGLSDGLWYFHIKARKQGVWGATTDFLVQIDTTPPAEFTPTVDYLAAAVANRFLISFFTTDGLSGVDHYEIGVIDKTAAASESPVFVQSDSPYQLSLANAANARVIVRAFDRAGNTRDESIDVKVPFAPWNFFLNHEVTILEFLLGLGLLLFILHYFFGHHIYRRLRQVWAILKGEKGTGSRR